MSADHAITSNVELTKVGQSVPEPVLYCQLKALSLLRAERAVGEGRDFGHERLRRTTIHIVTEVLGGLVEERYRVGVNIPMRGGCGRWQRKGDAPRYCTVDGTPNIRWRHSQKSGIASSPN